MCVCECVSESVCAGVCVCVCVRVCVQAEAFCARERNRLPVFALGHSTIALMRALMTFAHAEVQEANDRLQHTLVRSVRVSLCLCVRYRVPACRNCPSA